jgi:predicted transcriptional regulator
MSAGNPTANKTKIQGRKQMQQASSTEIQSAIQKAVQAFKEMKYPVTKKQLIEKAKSMNVRSEVMQAIENIPDKEYHSTADVLKEFEGIQNAVQAFRDVKFPATKNQLLEEARKLNARSEVIKALEACPEREYTNFSDVIKECRSKSNW